MVVARVAASAAGHHGQKAVRSFVKSPPAHFMIKGEHCDFHVKLSKVNATINGMICSEHRKKLFNAVVCMRKDSNTTALYLTLSIESGVRKYKVEPHPFQSGHVQVSAEGWFAGWRDSRLHGAASVQKILNGLPIDGVTSYDDLGESYWQVNGTE